MLDGTNPKLLYEWMEFAQIEGLSEERADIRNAITCSVISDALGAKKKGGGSFSIQDFMPKLNTEQASTEIPAERAEALMRRRYGNSRKSRS